MSRAYRTAGVDLAEADALVEDIRESVTATWGDHVVGRFGGFAGGFRIPPGYSNPVLLMTTDGVGTKLDLARRTGLVDGVGSDLVAMCVDDLAAAGARPLAFTDYLAVGSIHRDRDAAIVASVAEACRVAGCALVGGEIAEHPGTMDADSFDLAGAAVGVVDEADQVTGANVAPGDLVLGITSPNLRSNGFSLVRHVVGDEDLGAPFPGDSRTIAEVLLEPSVIYAPAVLAAVATKLVKGLAHITGGGLMANLPRTLPAGAAAVLDRSTWEPPPVFAIIQRLGEIDPDEMYSVFNMGIGFAVIVAPDRGDTVTAAITAQGHEVSVIGRVVPGDGTVQLCGRHPATAG